MSRPEAPIDQLTSAAKIFLELEGLGGGPSRLLGQNFLINRPLLDALVADAGLERGSRVLEIGPGLGHLTRAILERKCQVVAVEKDRRLAESLSDRLGNPPRLEVVHGDILEIPTEEILERLGGPGFLILGNLPYYCSSAILARFFEDWYPHWAGAGILLQEEVVDRLVAAPGGRTYGRLSVLVQSFSKASKGRRVAPHLFVPKPEISSAWCLLEPLPWTGESRPDARLLSVLTGWCFGERRKTLLNNLGRELGKEVAGTILSELGIDPGRRPETLSVEEYGRLLASLLESLKQAITPP